MRAFPAALLLCCFSYFNTFGQDTIPVMKPAKVRPHFMFGLNVTQTFTGLLHPGTTIPNADPYQVVWRVGDEKRRWRSGINFASNKSETKDPFQGNRETRTQKFEWRNGIEWNFQVGNRFDLYWGLDLAMGFGKEEVVTSGFGSTSTIETKTTKLGAGPVTGIMFRLTPRVMLSTECTIYGILQWDKTKIKAFPEVSSNSTSQGQFGPVLPTSLFINYYF